MSKKTEELYPLHECDFTIINHETHNFFINTTNIYNATELLTFVHKMLII